MLKKNDTRQSIVIKALFFLSFAAAASWLTFFYVYLKEVPKLSGYEIGILAMFQQFNNIIILPVWGLWADRFGRRKVLIYAFVFTMLLLPGFLLTKGVATITLYLILLTLVYNPISSLLDTIALDYQAQTMGATSYGEIRLWASLGWGVSSAITGFFINSSNLSLIFPLGSALYLVVLALILSLYKPLRVTKNLIELNRGVIWDLLKAEKKLLLFLIIVFIYSIFSAPIYLIINVYYYEIGAATSIIGWAFLVQSVSELPFFFYGKKLVDRFGARQVFVFAMFATGLRMAAYGINSSPQIAILIGVIHGISIGLFFVSVISFVHSIVPAHLRSTGQSLFYTFYAVGVAFGNVVTGVLSDYISVKFTMLALAGGIAALLVAMFIGRKYFTHLLPQNKS